MGLAPVSIWELLIKGIPENFISMIALYIFTNTKVTIKKYVILSLILAVITYFTRWFPINLATHTMLVLLALMLIHLAANKGDLNYIIKTIVSVIVIALIILISETLDFLLLAQIYGQEKANEILLAGDPILRSLAALPSIAIFGAVVLVVYLIKKTKTRKRNGNLGEKAGE